MDYKLYILEKINIPPIEKIIPTEEDIKESKKKADELKHHCKDKILTNIIRFQEEEIPYWNERRLIDETNISLIIIFISFIISLITFFFISSTSQTITQNPTSRKLFVTIILIMYLMLAVSLLFTFKMTLIAVTVDRFRKKGFNFRKGIFYIIDYLKYMREICKHISSIELPVEKILTWHLAICRDYGRLTASLLYNIYDNAEIFIINIPNHQASGIKLNGEIFIIDPNFSSPTNKLSILNDWLKEHDIDNEVYCLERKIKNFTILIYTKSQYHKFMYKYLNECHENR